jgi:NAD(P)-dependent dehydrogenase (short-subunit alcohol dehydrogenase family)
MPRLEGATAVVTGGAKGIGEATCRLFAREGARVAVTDIADEIGPQVAENIRNNGGTAKYWHLDVSREDEVREVFREVNHDLGGIDVLVNNAGISGVDKPTHEIPTEEWDQVMAINLKGVFLCTKHVIEHMRHRGKGSIINLSSIYGIVSAPDIPAYHASKGGVRLMTKTDALLYAKENIRVNSVHPGFIWTPLVESYLKEKGDVAEGRKSLDDLHPIGHVGEPDDVAFGILYLASDESKFVTGCELVIDGGYTSR